MIALLEDNRNQLESLCRRCKVRRLDVFGSVTTDQFDPATSDLDFVVEFLPLPEGARADAYFGLLEGLQALFGRPVDLVVSRAITNPYFREAVNETREPVYAA